MKDLIIRLGLTRLTLSLLVLTIVARIMGY